MSRLILLPIFTMIFFLFGCVGKKTTTFEDKTIGGKAVIIKKTYDKKGNLLIEELLNKDSIKNGYYKEFILGKIRDSGNYSSGQKEGAWYRWDLNGDVIKIENWFSGKQFGEQIDYYNKVKPKEQLRVYKYSFYNVEGQKIFESKFDINGKLLNTTGLPLYCAYNSSNIHVGDSYEFICFFGAPQGFKWFFSIKEAEKGKQKILFKQEFNSNNSNPELLSLPFAKKYLHTKKYLSKGEYNWLLSLTVESLSGQTILKDSTQLTVSVE